MKNLGYFFYILVLGLWTGGVFIYTFVLTPALFRTYSKDRAGEIVGTLFPAYFIFTIVVSAAALFFLFAAYSELSKTAVRVSAGLAVAALLIALYVKIGLYPQIQEVKQAVSSFETTAAEDPMRRRFRKLHAASAVLNLIFLADGTALLAVGTLMRKGLD